jgi:hypothetical protein
MAPEERDTEYDAANPASDLLGPLCKPLSGAEIARRRRMMDQPAGQLSRDTIILLQLEIDAGWL